MATSSDSMLAISVFPSLTGAESVSDEELAKQSVINYVEAVQTGNIYESVKWVVDTRFSSTDEQLEQYKESLSSNPFSDVSIKSIVPASNDTFTASVELTRKDDGETNKVSYQVIKRTIVGRY
ncbi:hypothetical protein C1I60_05145 [Paenibacillus terrae]|uniref:Uncharacterized protein n=1 Tax=Paenibacillus terrae TaxID=159743 RepID=A0A4U2Q3R0_9BACL|nr:hypothetical protein [Paenibacillus terrae]TKH45840.1 hypothetical protein C1I60_05145 [Paenibacillus terrae]